MNWEQVKGIVERLVTIGVTYAVGKGYIPADQAAPLVIGLVALASVAWGAYVNTHGSLTQAAQNVKAP